MIKWPIMNGKIDDVDFAINQFEFCLKLRNCRRSRTKSNPFLLLDPFSSGIGLCEHFPRCLFMPHVDMVKD